MTPLVFADEPAVPETFNALLYGPPGSGKSTAAATLAVRGPILWVNAEGAGALAYPRRVARGRLHEVRVTEATQDVKGVIEQVRQHVRSGAEPRPRTVVIDTLAKVREALVRQLVVQHSKNSLQQYGQVADVLGRLVRELRDAPVNLVLLAHEEVQEVNDEHVVQPLIGGQLTRTVPGEMDVVAYVSVLAETGDDGRPTGDVRRVAQFVDGRGRRAKDRSGALGRWREGLDLDEWLTVYQRSFGGDLPWEGDSERDGERAAADPETDRRPYKAFASVGVETQEQLA